MPSKIFLMPAVALAALIPCCYMSTGAVFSTDVLVDTILDPGVEDWEREEVPPIDAPDEIDGIDVSDVPLDPDAEDWTDTVDSPAEPDVQELPPGLEWVSIPAGSFDMGCSPGDTECDDDESPRHTVTVSAFWMTKTEITQAQYEAVIGTNPSFFNECGGDCPVETVTWHEAKAFCEEIGGRLPSEAEWEYAARAGTTTPWTCADASWSCLGDIAWYFGGTTHAVKGKAANAFGLYDMLGNVWEWVEDCWHNNYEGAPSTGGVWAGGDCDYRVLRGGSWDFFVEYLRVSRRGRSDPGDWYYYFGLRCAQDAT